MKFIKHGIHFTEEQLLKLEEFFADKGAAFGESPYCGEKEADVDGFYESQMVTYEPGKPPGATGMFTPLVGVRYRNCKYFMFFHAGGTGVLR